MKNELLQKKLTYGIFLGMAISSRFLLNLNPAVWAQVISMLLLFFLISAVLFWLRQLREFLPGKQFTLKTTVLFTFQLFLIAAVFSSLFKYIYFMYINPAKLQMLLEQSLNLSKEFFAGMKLSPEEMNAINTPPSLSSMALGISIGYIFLNSLGGFLLGFMNWFFFKKEQELRKKI